MRRIFVAAAAFLPALSCGTFLAVDDDPPSPPPPDANVETPDAAAPVKDAAPDDAAPPAPALCDAGTVLELVATGDTSVATSECAGSITHGADRFVNFGVLAMVVRFNLGAEGQAALSTENLRSLTLRFAHDPACDGDGACAPPLNPIAGALAVHVLRNDWTEGSGAAYGGADMCRRNSGNPGLGWGPGSPSAGAMTRMTENVDFGPTLGTQAFAGTPTIGAVAIPLSVKAVAADWKTYGGGALQISFFVSQTVSGGRIIVGTREHSTPAKRPSLRIERCQP